MNVENVEKLESSFIVSGNVKWCSCSGRKFGFPQKIKQNFHMTQHPFLEN